MTVVFDADLERAIEQAFTQQNVRLRVAVGGGSPDRVPHDRVVARLYDGGKVHRQVDIPRPEPVVMSVESNGPSWDRDSPFPGRVVWECRWNYQAPWSTVTLGDGTVILCLRYVKDENYGMG